jgi:hypothetical protein
MQSSRCQILKHEQLEELCVLAASGEIEPCDLRRVREHLQECEACRLLFVEIGELHSHHLSFLSNPGVEQDSARETRIKNSILAAAQMEGARFAEPVETILYEKPKIELIGRLNSGRIWFVGSALCLACACLALAVTWRQAQSLRSHLQMSAQQTTIFRAEKNKVEANAAEKESEKQESQEIDLLRAQVASLGAERLRLERILQEQLSENEKLQKSDAERQKELGGLTDELQNARTAEARVSQKLEQLNMERASEQTAIAAQNREIRSLNERLEEQAAAQDRNRDVVSAERDLRELVGARKLHLFDVSDTDGDGKTRKAFGRVFYVEGQALLFYAYDLSEKNSDTSKYAYYVWGNKDGNLNEVRNLGTLNRDDPTQKRWKLRVDDGKVLTDIDRVFVTVETVAKLGPRPHGKQILYSFLGAPPNHP